MAVSPRRNPPARYEDCVCYELLREGFDILLKEYPELGAHLLGNLARELSRRLRQTSADRRLTSG